jgi:hypothetical protein
MQVTIDLPDEIALRLAEQCQDLSRRALESRALRWYRTGALTSPQLRELLGFETRMELDAFFRRAGVELAYSQEELARDMGALSALSGAELV